MRSEVIESCKACEKKGVSVKKQSKLIKGDYYDQYKNKEQKAATKLRKTLGFGSNLNGKP